MFHWLTTIAIISLVTYFFIHLKQQTHPKKIICEFFITLSLSMIASYIFYVLNVYIPNIEQQKKDAYYIATTLHNIREHSLQSTLILKDNILMSKKNNPDITLSKIFTPNIYVKSVDYEYNLRSQYQCALLMTSESPVQILLTQHLGGVFKPEKLDDFDCFDLILHYEDMNNAIENMLFDLKQLKENNNFFATEILKKFPKITCGFENAIHPDKQSVFLSLLPKDEATKFKADSKKFIQFNYTIN